MEGRLNTICDALSRSQFTRFAKLAPEVDPAPCLVPDIIWNKAGQLLQPGIAPNSLLTYQVALGAVTRFRQTHGNGLARSNPPRNYVRDRQL